MKESSKTIEEIAELNREALNRLGYLLFTPKTIENILTRLFMEYPNTDPKLFQTLKHDLGIK